jgi:hypothetical protein
MDYHRKELIDRYNHLYDVLSVMDNPFLCLYCGEPAECRDHVPPLSRIEAYRRFNLEREVYVKVWCCTECNRLLSDSLQIDLIERIDNLKQLLRLKYKTEGITKLWTKTEIKEAQLTGRLKKYIQGRSALEKLAVNRVEFGLGYHTYLQYCINKFGDDYV